MAPLQTSTQAADPLSPASRVQFIEHAGKKILFINYAHCDVTTIKSVVRESQRVVALQPLNSVLTLSDVTGAAFDQEVVSLLKGMAISNGRYVKRAAVIGISGLQRLIYEAVQAFAKRSIPLFPSRQEALDWLAQP